MLELTTPIGMIAGFICIIITIYLSGDINLYIDLPSMFIVFGGVIASTIVAYPLATLKSLGKIIGNTFRSKPVDFNADVELVLRIANIARREGILALEEAVENMEDEFLKKGIMLIVDGSDPELVRSILETDLDFLKERHGAGQSVLLSMSAFSPAYGMIGTLIGLVNMLNSLSDLDSLGPNMAVALVTTFYGVVLANLFFTPMAKKLSVFSSEEYLHKELILEGILSIQDGENPRIIREKLNAFLSNSQIAAVQQAAAAREQAAAAQDDDD